MKKEMIISILVGLIFGLIITYGVYRAKTSLNQPPSPEPLLTSPAPTPTNANNGMLRLLSPEDELVTPDTEIAITGSAPANSHVVVFINNTEHITSADETGNFSVTGSLESGSNVIIVHVITEQGETAVEERTVIVSTANLDDPTDTATDSAEKAE